MYYSKMANVQLETKRKGLKEDTSKRWSPSIEDAHKVHMDLVLIIVRLLTMASSGINHKRA